MDIRRNKLIVITGQTATGKSDLAVCIARQINGEVISADSRQVYKGLDIGTGKITKQEMLGVKHYLLDVIRPKNRITVTDYATQATKALKQIDSRKKIPIVCGGTGFYIQALVDGIIFPDVKPDTKLRQRLNTMTAAKLFKMLEQLDPERASKIDKNNSRRIIRAIEIAKTLGEVPPVQTHPINRNMLFIGLYLPPTELKERIMKRLKSRIKAGMVKEAVNLHKKGLSWKRMEELGLEYRYLAKHLKGEISHEEMIDKLYFEIWHYAKRQMTLLKKDSRIHWFLPTQKKTIIKQVREFMK